MILGTQRNSLFRLWTDLLLLVLMADSNRGVSARQSGPTIKALSRPPSLITTQHWVPPGQRGASKQ